ncbi:MAG TPA: hypothetical protein PLH20_13530, partial [Flavobacterium sp.]|nr:hypothetical protein [Flavobacterium sp.]
YHDVKLLRISQKTMPKKGLMVEHIQLIVYGYQIRVNAIFLNFQIISIGKIRNNELNIPFV